MERANARVQPGARMVVPEVLPEVPAGERRTEWRDSLPTVTSILNGFCVADLADDLEPHTGYGARARLRASANRDRLD